MQRQTFIRLSAIMLITIVLCLSIAGALRSSYITLADAPALSGQVAQAAQTGSSDSSVPISGKDFTLSDVHYFSNKTWAVVSFEPTGNDSFNAGSAVLQKKNGLFRVVLGPSSILSTDYTYSLPSDVVTYLNEQGLFDD